MQESTNCWYNTKSTQGDMTMVLIAFYISYTCKTTTDDASFNQHSFMLVYGEILCLLSLLVSCFPHFLVPGSYLDSLLIVSYLCAGIDVASADKYLINVLSGL